MNRVEFIYAGGNVKRYHTVPTIKEQTVAHHSANVALLCSVLSDGNPSAALLMAALTHDLPECVTGDMPSPAKLHTPGAAIQDAVILRSEGLHYALTEEEELTLHLADNLEGYLFCCQEIKMGNSLLNVVLERYGGYIRGLPCPMVLREVVIEIMNWGVLRES